MSSWIFFKLSSFSWIKGWNKISKFGVGHSSGLLFRTKKGPKYGPILTKLGIFIKHTWNQKPTQFYWNRTIFYIFTRTRHVWKIVRFQWNFMGFWFQVCWIKILSFVKIGPFFGPFLVLKRKLEECPTPNFDIVFHPLIHENELSLKNIHDDTHGVDFTL